MFYESHDLAKRFKQLAFAEEIGMVILNKSNSIEEINPDPAFKEEFIKAGLEMPTFEELEHTLYLNNYLKNTKDA